LYCIKPKAPEPISASASRTSTIILIMFHPIRVQKSLLFTA